MNHSKSWTEQVTGSYVISWSGTEGDEVVSSERRE